MTGSPVRVDSFTCKEIASINSPSAGISSPVSSTTISPTTISRLGISCMFPLRRTFMCISSLTWFNNSNFLLASISNQKPTPVARNIAKKIPIVSAYSLCMIEIISDKTAATNNIRIIGSLNFSRKSFHKGVCGGGVMIFSPNCLRLCCTSESFKPE